MSVNFRYPNISAATEREQLAQIKSYLHQLVEQLNYALPTLGTGTATGAAEATTQTASTGTYSVQGGELSYYELRSLIVQEAQEVERLFEQLSTKMESDYIKNEDLPEAIDQALAQAKESGEFDGQQGIQGEPGVPGVSVTHEWTGTILSVTSASGTSFANLKGDKGDPGEGYTLTEEDVADISTQAAQNISFTLDEEGNLYYEVIEGGNTDKEVEE